MIAGQWEKVGRLGAEKRLDETQARRVLAEIREAVNGETLPSAIARDFLAGWAENRKAGCGGFRLISSPAAAAPGR
jgi:hypothetical protein